MRSRLFWVCFVALLFAGSQSHAQDPRSGATSSGSSTSSSARRTTSPARGPLPDPALLDGSAQAAEKRPDYGMLGQFEIPGDENSKSGKVGGQQPPPGQQGGGGGQQGQQGGQGGMSGMPPMQGGGGGGAAGQQSPQGMPPQGGGGGAAGDQSMNIPPGGGGGLPGGKPVDPSQANGQGGGTQVSELKTDAANAGGVMGAGGEPNAAKPQQVALGDPAMQIKGVANAPSVVGASQPAGQTQQMEKAVGQAAKGSAGDNTNKGVEKGRVVPAGL
jgi:hypothetical protein